MVKATDTMVTTFNADTAKEEIAAKLDSILQTLEAGVDSNAAAYLAQRVRWLRADLENLAEYLEPSGE